MDAMADIDTGTPKAELKKLLHASQPDSPVRVGCAPHKDSKLAYLRIAKTGNAKAIAAELKKDYKEVTAVSSGSALKATLDTGPGLKDAQKADEKLVVFRLEKPLPGIAKRLKNTLKGTGFAKVVVLYDDGSSDADLEDEEGEGTAAAPAAASAPPPPPPPPPPQQPAAAAPLTGDLAALQKRLASLIPRIAGADGAAKAEMAKAAAAGNAAIKAANAAEATTAIETLEKLLGVGAAANPPEPGSLDKATLTNTLANFTLLIGRVASGDTEAALVKLSEQAAALLASGDLAGAKVLIEQLRAGMAKAQEEQKAAGKGGVAYAKTRLIWLATRKKLNEDLEKLHAEITSTYKGIPELGEIDKKYQSTVGPILETLDEELADKLDEVANEADATKRAKLIEDAKKVIDRYQKYINSENLFAELDANPFVPLSIRDTVGKTLTAIAATVR
jgi:hypothetical protein